MKTIKEHRKVILDYYKSRIEEYETIFDLKKYMIEKGICPRCGKHVQKWKKLWCFACDFILTEWEINQILYENKKGILKRKLKMKRKK